MQVWYLVFRVLLGWSTFGFGALVATLFVFFVNSFCLNAVLTGAAAGTQFSYYQDLLFVNWFVMVFASAVSSSFWYAYLVVPGYGVFRLGKMFVAWIQTPDPEPVSAANMTEAQQKALAKKEKKAKRQEKFMRR